MASLILLTTIVLADEAVLILSMLRPKIRCTKTKNKKVGTAVLIIQTATVPATEAALICHDFSFF